MSEIKMNLEVLNKLDQKIYIFVINIVSLLKSLQKENIENEKTAKISRLAKQLSKVFNNFYEKNNKQKNFSEIKTKILSLIEQIQEILIEEFDDINKRITHEKADIFFTANKIKDLTNNL